MGRLPLLGILLAAATLLTVPTVAAETKTLAPGEYTIGTANLTVEAGDTLVIQGPAKIHGTGRILVHGSLVVDGRPDAWVNLSVPIAFDSGAESRIQSARLTLVPGAALNLTAGALVVRDTLLHANERGVRVGGAGVLVAENVTFLDHPGEALYVEGSADVRVANATFRGNGRGVAAYSATRLDVEGSRFEGNAEHVVVDLGPWSAPAGTFRLARNHLLAPASPASQLPALLLRHDRALSGERTIALEENRIEGAAVGIRAEGRGLVVESARDTLVGNAIGLQVSLATVRLQEPTLDNDRDVEGSGNVNIVDARVLRAAPAATTASEGPLQTGLAAAALVALLLLGLGLGFALRRRRGARPAARAEATPAPPEPAPVVAPEPDVPAASLAALTSAERRVLDDVAAHPGTPQRAIADRLGATRQAIHYHVKKLEARGLLVKTVEGRETRLSVARGASAPPVTPTQSDEKR